MRRERSPVKLRKGSVYLGHGFAWTIRHRERYEQWLAEFPEGGREGGGTWALAGVEPDHRPVYLPEALLPQHLLISGTTGCGKTRLIELLTLQAIARGDAVAVIDPKGDADYFRRVREAAARRGRQVRYFSLARPEESATYNPVGSFQHPREVADRIAALLPGEGEGMAFRNFAWDVVNRVVAAMRQAGHPVTLGRLRRFALERLDELPEVEPLRPLRAHPRDHFAKMISSLGPILGRLTAGSAGRLLSCAEPELTWERIMRERLIVYFSLGSLAAPETSRTVARLALLDLQGALGRALERGESGRISIFVDEFSDLALPEFIGVLNKSRGAGVSITIATQTFSDLEANLGSEARALQVLGNVSTIVQFRTNDQMEARLFSRIAGSVPARTLSRTHAYEPALLRSGSHWVEDFRATHGTSERIEDRELVPAHYMFALPNLHAFARAGGQIYKLVVPLIEP